MDTTSSRFSLHFYGDISIPCLAWCSTFGPNARMMWRCHTSVSLYYCQDLHKVGLVFSRGKLRWWNNAWAARNVHNHRVREGDVTVILIYIYILYRCLISLLSIFKNVSSKRMRVLFTTGTGGFHSWLGLMWQPPKANWANLHACFDILDQHVLTFWICNIILLNSYILKYCWVHEHPSVFIFISETAGL